MKLEPALDWRSAGLFLTVDPDWKRKLWIGGWLLIVPVVGWPIILGYRREVLTRVVHGETPILPEWRGNLSRLLGLGLGATFVIHLHFVPLYAWLAHLYAAAGVAVPWLPVVAFFISFPVFSTLVIPLGLVVLRFVADGTTPHAVGDLELLGLSAAFAFVTFYIPAGFLQVSRSGRLRSAFAVRRNVQLISRAPLRYAEAWIGSSILSLIGHLCVPLSPFGVVWCYLAIVFSFNEVPLGADESRRAELDRSWFPYFRREHWRLYDTVRRGLVVEYRRAAAHDRGAAEAGPGAEGFRALELGPLFVPLPARVSPA